MAEQKPNGSNTIGDVFNEGTTMSSQTKPPRPVKSTPNSSNNR